MLMGSRFILGEVQMGAGEDSNCFQRVPSINTPRSCSGTSVLGPPKGDDAARVIAAAKAGQESSSGPAGSSIQLVLYANGFQVDGGPFRGEAAEDKQFMADIAAGQVPAELRKGAGGPIDVNIVDKRGQQYTPEPAPAYTAFAGSGQALSGSPAAVTDNIIVAAAVKDFTQHDDGSGSVRIQVKLPGGARCVLNVPKSTSVGALCAQIVAKCPALQTFQLVSGFPPQPVSVDLEQSVVQAGLAGSTVQVKEA